VRIRLLLRRALLSPRMGKGKKGKTKESKATSTALVVYQGKGAKPPKNGGLAFSGMRAAHAGGGQRTMGGSMSKGHIAACCALLNPFNPLCRGMKLPDGLNGRSLPWQIHGGL